jgi:Tfp pilus assembly protein PilP
MKSLLLSIMLWGALASPAKAMREKQSTEKFELHSYSVWFVSSPRKDGTRFAYLKDKEGFIHHVEIGYFVGCEGARIQKIESTGIQVEESVEESDGHWVEKKINIPYKDVGQGGNH